jgi:hypothetical protein
MAFGQQTNSHFNIYAVNTDILGETIKAVQLVPYKAGRPGFSKIGGPSQ